jgi:chaperonin GroES
MVIKSLIKHKVLVEISEAETQTASGLFLPGSAVKNKLEGKVLMVGPLVTSMKEGDMIRYYDHCGAPVTHDNKNCLILNELNDIVAVL